MPTIPTSPPPAEPGQSSPQAGELQLSLSIARYTLLALIGSSTGAVIWHAWGPLWRNVLHFALVAGVALIIRLLWRQLAWLMAVLSSLVVLIFLLLLLRPPGNPAQRCMLTAEDLTKLAANCKAGASDAVKPLSEAQQAQSKELSSLKTIVEVTKTDLSSELKKTADATEQHLRVMDDIAKGTKAGVDGLVRDLPKTAKSIELSPIAIDSALAAKRIEIVSKTQIYQGQTLTEINGACRKR